MSRFSFKTKKFFLLSSTLVLFFFSSCKPKENVSWDFKPVKYENFTDYGNYVIKVDPYEAYDLEKGIKLLNAKYDQFTKPACTATAKRNTKGEVLIGRNLDIYISNSPMYITEANYGKYKAYLFSYLGSLFFEYNELLGMKKLPQEFIDVLPLNATDGFNEKGLYIEANMREPDARFICTGTNPGGIRVTSGAVTSLVSTNCATVKEALEFLKQFDFYTMGDGGPLSNWNYAFMIGDATGEYGLIEIAQNEISYLPYQNGQGNYYRTPKWNAIEHHGSGYGRIEIANENLMNVQTEKEMLDNMKRCMWTDSLLYAQYSFRDEKGKLHFVDDKGNPALDFRSDASALAYENEAYPTASLLDDTKFEEVKEKFVSNINKKTADGYSLYEKVVMYENGNEKPLRDDASIWTTGLSYGVNCKKRHLYLKFWQNDNLIFELQW